MNVLVADKFEKSGIEGLKAAGCDVIYEPDLKDDALAEAIGSSGVDVLVVRSTKVTTPMLDAGRLALIVRAGAGYNTIDVAGASKRGIYVSNCPGKNAIAVAERRNTRRRRGCTVRHSACSALAASVAR
jgi:D-3-phosphoglycerate dehydrogenase / 2-oxoglutarate reductase